VTSDISVVVVNKSLPVPTLYLVICALLQAWFAQEIRVNKCYAFLALSACLAFLSTS